MFGELYASEAFGRGLKLLRRGLGAHLQLPRPSETPRLLYMATAASRSTGWLQRLCFPEGIYLSPGIV